MSRQFAPADATARCGICGGTAERQDVMEPNHRRRGAEGWRCRNCETGGAVLRDHDGRPVRLPHVLTGEGFVYAGGAA